MALALYRTRCFYFRNESSVKRFPWSPGAKQSIHARKFLPRLVPHHRPLLSPLTRLLKCLLHPSLTGLDQAIHSLQRCPHQPPGEVLWDEEVRMQGDHCHISQVLAEAGDSTEIPSAGRGTHACWQPELGYFAVTWCSLIRMWAWTRRHISTWDKYQRTYSQRWKPTSLRWNPKRKLLALNQGT